MEVWASYSLTDLLLFSPTAYFRLYELNNLALWPFQLLMVVAGLVLAWMGRGEGSGEVRAIGLLLALSWGCVAWWFLYRQYAQIYPMATWFSIVFALQALMLLSAGLAGCKVFGRRAWHSPVNPGLLLLLYALILHPVIGLLSGRSLAGMELFGLAPDPTALATLGILLMRRGTVPWLLGLIPLLWCTVSGLTYLAMEIDYGLLTPLAAVVALVAAALLRVK
ncbi:MAG: DUF6064 family protein [Candidatus Sedimenticola sp. 6PFRAG7]